MNKPTEKPSATRPPESSHTHAKSSSEECSQAPKAKRDLEERAPARCRRAIHIKTTTAIQDVPGVVKVKDADCVAYQQPCLHYNSIINAHPAIDYRNNPCPYKKRDSDPELQAKRDWRNEHPKNDWWAKIPPVAGAKDCEADEWPPARLYYINDGYDTLEGHGNRNINKPQFIRLMDGNQNGAAGSLWKGCPRVAANEEANTEHSDNVGPNGITTSYTMVRAVFTRTTMRINFVGLVHPDNDDGLQVNVCQPHQQNVDHRGFALLNRDPWFNGKLAAQALTADYLKTPNFKRSWINPDHIAVMEANSSKKVTDEELKKDFGLIRCSSDGCEKQLAALPPDAAMIYGPPPKIPVKAPVTSSTLSIPPGLINRKAQATPQKGITSTDYPLRTQGVESL